MSTCAVHSPCLQSSCLLKLHALLQSIFADAEANLGMFQSTVLINVMHKAVETPFRE